MITLPNLLSILRIPLAFAFFSTDIYIRLYALAGAMLTDFFDGFLARRYNMCSRSGTSLDPITDKFFVCFLMAILFQENAMTLPQALSMLGRDFAVFFFGLYLILAGQWGRYRIRAILCGKIATALQLIILSALTLHYPVPGGFYILFVLLGFLSLVELYLSQDDLEGVVNEKK